MGLVLHDGVIDGDGILAKWGDDENSKIRFFENSKMPIGTVRFLKTVRLTPLIFYHNGIWDRCQDMLAPFNSKLDF